MAALLTQSIPIIVNSDPTAGAENVSADGSSFQITLHDPIMIPRSAVDCKASVTQASIWNTSFNIAAAYSNNQFEFTTSVAPAGTYTWTIPDGLYSVAGLNGYLSAQFVNTGLPANLITGHAKKYHYILDIGRFDRLYNCEYDSPGPRF